MLGQKKKRNPLIRFVNFIVKLILLVAVCATGLFYWAKWEFEKERELPGQITIVIPSGSNLTQIAEILEEKGIISSALLFRIGARINGQQGSIKAGEYGFSSAVSMKSVLTDLVEGNSILHSITIPEGWTSYQIIEKIKSEPKLTGDLEEIPAEGTLHPETYKFTRGMARVKLVEKMRRSHEDALENAWNSRDADLPVANPQELLILASIIEKETGETDERDRVAGVFVNRLRKNMRLQSDPTILYGLYRGQAWMKSRSILQSEKDEANSYNTYQISALPPGPIANVGWESLQAAANPMQTDELYFVADGSGGHVFAKTYEEHLKNVKKWREIERINQ